MAKATTNAKSKTKETEAPPAQSYRDKLRNRAAVQATKQGEGGEFKKKVVGSFMIDDGDKETVRPLHNAETIPLLRTHAIKERNFQRSLCMADFGLPCPACDAEIIQADVMLVFLFVPGFIAKKGSFKDAKGETKTYDLNPVSVWRRTPGKDAINHDEILDLDENYAKTGGLAGRDWTIKKKGSGKDTQFTMIADPDATAFKLSEKQRKNLSEGQYEALTKVLAAIEAKDIKALVDLAIPNFILPPGVDEWPTGEQYIGMDEETVTEE